MHETADLLQRFTSAVYEIQQQYSLGGDVISNCPAVDQLCQRVDSILHHGLKEGLLSWASQAEVSFWPLAVEVTNRENIEEINRLRLRTSRHKCLAWIRLALKENTLGSYIGIITRDEKFLREFFHPHAFIFDKQKVEALTTSLVYGISTLDFDISLTEDMSEASKDLDIIGSLPDHLPARSGSFLNDRGRLSTSLQDDSTLGGRDFGAERASGKRKKKKKKKPGVALIADGEDQQAFSATGLDAKLGTGEATGWSNGCTGDLPPTGNEVDLPPPADGVESIAQAFSAANLGALNSMAQSVEDHRFGSGICSFDQTDSIEQLMTEESACSVGQETGTSLDLQPENATGNRLGLGRASSGAVPEHSSGARGPVPFEMADSVIDASLQCSDASDTDPARRPRVNDHSATDSRELPESDRGSESSNDAADHSTNVSCDSTSSLPDENRVSLATFELGTPKQITDPSELVPKQTRAEATVTYDDEDCNIVPGIHTGSFNGSGSFPGLKQRTPDDGSPTEPGSLSQKISSSLKNSPVSDSWTFVTEFFSSPGRTSSVRSGASEESYGGFNMFDDLLGVEEDHFSPPEQSFMGVSTTEELEHAIESCKGFIASTPEHSEERAKLVDKLVKLRLKLQEIQDVSVEPTSNKRRVMGHEFVKEDNPSNKIYCDKCGRSIWMWQSLYTCDGCNYNSHRRCLDFIRRPCASRKLSVSTYNTKICQESGLSSQQYKCVECRKRIALTKSSQISEARLCDYSGQFFCEDCHWNDVMVIPARVIHNWDFAPRKVSRQTKQLLNLMASRPLLNVGELNSALFKFVGELREVKRLREEILIMKKYFVTCREALESKLLLQLQGRPHFVDSSSIYSLQDLVDVETGTLLPAITRTHSLFLTHIKTECQLCQAKGFVCEICRQEEIIFAFDPHSIQCPGCRAVFHKLCFKSGTCPKCQRRKEREKGGNDSGSPSTRIS